MEFVYFGSDNKWRIIDKVLKVAKREFTEFTGILARCAPG
jgi:hypothetical protein